MSDPDLEIVATKVADMVWLRIQNLHAKVSPFASTPMSNTPSKHCFFLFLGFEAPGPSNVFYYVNDEWMAKELCKLFESDPGVSRELKIQYLMIDGHDISQLVLLQESVDELSIYTDPDLGIYDPKPSECLIQRAQYYSRANDLEIVVRNIRNQKKIANEIQSSSFQSDSLLTDSEFLAFETVRNLLEKHRLTFLYFAAPKQFDPSLTGNSLETVTLEPEEFRKFDVGKVDENGDFLFTYRRRLEQFAQACFRRFGSGQGNKPRVPLEDDTIVEVEGGTLPFWRLDEVACVHLEESADQILSAMRDATRKKFGRLLQRFIPAIKLSLHDANKPKWYASDSVRWEYLSQIDAILHELRTFELGDPDSSGSASPQDPMKDSGSKASSASERTLDDLLKEVPEEDCRNASCILLMWFAEAYHRLLEATTSHSEWLTVKDMDLNHSYIRTIQNLSNLLSKNRYLNDFPQKFEPIFQDLYPSTIADVDWQLMVAPHADSFLATVQQYVVKKGTFEFEEGSPGWIMLQMFLDEVQTAIKNADNYDHRMVKKRQQFFGPKTGSDADSSNVKAEINSKSSDKAIDETPPAESLSNSKLSFPEGTKWSEISMRFLDAHNVQVTFRDQSQRFHFTQMNMADGRSNTKPIQQWYLLESFAREKGVITWESNSALLRWKKHKQGLCKTLRELFDVVGEPIVYMDDEKGWKTVFKVHES
jgi:hypothetical protein